MRQGLIRPEFGFQAAIASRRASVPLARRDTKIIAKQLLTKGFRNGDADTNFNVEITVWRVVSPTKAIVSGKVFGGLRKVSVIGRSSLVS